MKKLITLTFLMLAFVTNALAWEPVIKETHWFGVYEYDDYYGAFIVDGNAYYPDQTASVGRITWRGNYLESVEITKEWTGQNPQQAPKVSFYSWLDHKLRFSVDNTSDWNLNMNNNPAYNRGIGLKNTSGSDKYFTVNNLKEDDECYIKYYKEGESQATEEIAIADGSTVTFNIPNNAVIRCVFITMTEYEKAETEIRPLTQEELQRYKGNAYSADDYGYRYSFSGAGVLEDKRGAVPYITMKFGSDNDMTFVRMLADAEETVTYTDFQEVTPEVYSLNRGEEVPHAAPERQSEGGYLPDVIYTDPTNLNGKIFAIVRDGNALYGSGAQNLGFDIYANAFQSSNSGYLFKAESVTVNGGSYYLLRLITPAGEEYNIWGNPGYLNSQPNEPEKDCSFILGLNNQYGQDLVNGAVWDIQYVQGQGMTLRNVGTGLYLNDRGLANNETPAYWTFCTINKEESSRNYSPDNIYTNPASLNGETFAIVRDGNALYGTDVQNLAFGRYANAFQSSNSGYYFKAESVTVNGGSYYLLRLITPAGDEYTFDAWGSTHQGYLNSQPANQNASFILGLNGRYGQDFENGAVWDIQYVEGQGMTLRNVGTGLYLNDNGSANNETPAYWTLCTIKEDANMYYVVNDPDNDNNPNDNEVWEAQLWVGNENLDIEEGDKVRVYFLYRTTDHNVTGVSSQVHTAPAAYLYWRGINNLDMNTGDWQECNQTITVSREQAGMKYFAFNLNPDNLYNEYQFAAFKLEVSKAETVINTNEGDFAAASVIDASDNFNPDDHQYHIKYIINPDPNNQYPDVQGTRTSEDLEEMFIGKEWSVFTAPHAPDNPYTSGGSYINYEGHNYEVIWRDIFEKIYPLFGNFFYFYPEVNGKLIVEYYVEGSNETPAFWWKSDGEGNLLNVGDQAGMHCVHHSANGNIGQTNGTNHYWLEADVTTGSVYYLCSLPTNNQHEHPVLRVKSYSFIPDFRVEPLYLVVNNTTDIAPGPQSPVRHAAEIFGGPYQSLNGPVNGTFERNGEVLNKVRYFGNVKSAKVNIVTEGAGNNARQFLNFDDIQFEEGKNPGGAIVVHLEDPCGVANFVLTIGYDAVEAKWGEENGKDKRVQEFDTETREVKHWDFYSNTNWDLGRYSDTNSKLYKEIFKVDGETADWNETYVNLQESKEPIFKSVYDMEADNVDMIHETEGLVIHSQSNQVGIYNENPDPTSEFQDRYIGLMPGAQLAIPRLKEGDRVVFKMGTYGNTDETVSAEERETTLTLTNAMDAMGKAITGDYLIGGSAEDGDDLTKDKTLPHGEYHFIVANTSNSDDDDFSITVKDGELLKIYSIVIYRNDYEKGELVESESDRVILTENQVVGDADNNNKRYILNKSEEQLNDNVVLHLNYRGLDEPVAYESHKRMTGTMTDDDIMASSDHDPDDYWYTYMVQKPKTGIFKTRLGVKTNNTTYVTDYADCLIPVGFRKTQEYPYTWDFTEFTVTNGIDENGDETDVEDEDLKIWDDFDMRVNADEYDGDLFAPGGQLYAGTEMFEDTEGLGVVPNGNDGAVNIASDNGGLKIGESDNEPTQIVVPSVPEGYTVYVRVEPDDKGQVGNDGTPLTDSYTDGGEKVYEIPVTGGDPDTKKDVIIDLNDVNVKGIAVTNIFKEARMASASESGKFYNSDCQAKDIDYSLTKYYTGHAMHAMFVTIDSISNVDTKHETAEVNGVEVTKPVAANTGLIVYTDENETLFPLFVPAEKKTDREEITGNMLVGVLFDETNGTASTDKLYKNVTRQGGVEKVKTDVTVYSGSIEPASGSTYRYLFTNQYNVVGQDESLSSDEPTFYRLKAAGGTLKSNRAYLVIEQSVLNGASIKSISLKGLGGGNNNGELDEPTAIELVEGANNGIDVNGTFYTVSGIKIQGLPKVSGIYIQNGKKIMVK